LTDNLEVIIQRTAVRALLLAEPDLLLLCRICLQEGERYIWIAPGGGVESGEQPEAALAREIREETSHEIARWAGPVWTRRHQFQFNGNAYDQRESFYLVRTDLFEPDHSANPAEIEREIFEDFRWWSLDEIRDSEETYVPGDLARHLGELLQGGMPAHPLEVGI
jgi:8-oxo-dGTP pyrophosphatase MutT (NUDIX family)